MGTSDGLICVSPISENDVVLWSPAAKELKEVSTGLIESANEFWYLIMALVVIMRMEILRL